MKERFSTVEKSIIGGIAAMLTLFSFITLFVFWVARTSSNKFVEKELLDITARLQESTIINFIKDFEKIFNYAYKKVDPKDVKNFTNLKFYEGEWADFKKAENNIHTIFFGNEDGKIFLSPKWKPESAYDPRIRPWYIPAKINPQAVHIEYYRSKVSGKDVFSVSRAVLDKTGHFVGVFCLDVTLDRLKDQLRQVTESSILKVYIIENHHIIATDDLTNRNILELNEDSTASKIMMSKEQVTHFPDNGGFWIKRQLAYPENWQIVVNICDAEINKKCNSIFQVTCILLLIQLLAGLFFIKFVLSTLRRQVVAIHDTLASSLARAKGKSTFNKLHRGEEIYHGIYSQISEHNRVLKETQEKVDIDDLTQSFSRYAYHRDIRLLLDEHQPFFHIILDFDDFKMINDTLGHTTGDELLKYFSSYIIINTRKDDKLYRYGGDEFVIICDGKDTISVQNRMNRLLNNFNRQLKKDLGVDVTVSFGISYCSGEEELSELIDSCDQELYQRKRVKKNK